ncbi:interleukin-4 receptor subunit alpha [Patagioenas fasciata monilis]|uniref:Interleukin-4 receptor subunit alpha n=1 Tax=Patagioenas fasciata monilis TaxID=372326 RepID=A0A1V4KSZ2_PATFA|nr:interleukin-4 receptor subunit alpha [Patagioenas fasciata monilis]
MAANPGTALHTLWILFFLYTTNEAVAAGRVQEFACVTDYDKELLCHWKVPAHTNCSKEFLLYYRKDFLDLPNHVCIPENGKDDLKCTCTIYPDYFVSGLTYILALQFNGTDMWNYSVTPALVVKPRAPKNLAIGKAENGNFNLSWEESYSPPSRLSGQPVIYEVKYWRKQHPTEVSAKVINYQAKSFEITASSLRRGYDYVASVRCNYTDYPGYWSEWSEVVEFHYDYQVTAEDILQMAVPGACILVMAVSVICYFCFTKVKKEWWDQIPNPAKSHLVVKNVKFSVLCYIDEIKFPFHDVKQSYMENQISCKNCMALSLSSQSIKGTDNIRNVEKSCSCHTKSGEWFPKGSSTVLTPETILVEESLEICECLTDIEAESQEEPGDPITAFEPHESSVSALREHTEHNDALASMFIDILADEDNTQDNKDSGIITGENKTFEKHDSENPSQQNAKESTAQSQQPCDIFHTVSLFTKASQDDYNCSTVSKKSEQSEESFESGYQSSSINSTSLDARDLQHMLHQGLFLCSSESHHDLCDLIQEPANKPSFGTKKDRISNSVQESFDPLASPSMGLCNSAYKSFDTLMSPSTEPCGSAYKSCDTLISPSMEPCGSAYKSFDTLLSPSTEPCGSAYRSFDILVSASKEPSSSAYKSFDSLMSQSMADNSLSTCVENICSSPPLTESSETPELTCRGQMYPPPSNPTCYTNYGSPCTGLDFQNICSEHPDFPSFSMPANDSASVFLPEEEIHTQLAYQNVQEKANMISCPIESQPSGYQTFDNAVRCSGTYCDSDSEVISRSLYKPFFHLLYNNLRETPPDTIIHEPDQRTDDRLCLVAQGFGSSIVPDLTSSANVTQTGDGSLRIISSSELSGESKDENTSTDEQLLHLLELNCQDFNSRERTMETKPNSFICAGKGLQESSSDRLSAALRCHTHSCRGRRGSAGENKEVLTPAVGTCGSAARSPEESLDSIGINLERKTAEPQELLVSDMLSSPLFVDKPCPSDSHTSHREGSRLAPAVIERPVELLGENNRKNGKKMKLVQALAQEDNCYMKVA